MKDDPFPLRPALGENDINRTFEVFCLHSALGKLRKIYKLMSLFTILDFSQVDYVFMRLFSFTKN